MALLLLTVAVAWPAVADDALGTAPDVVLDTVLHGTDPLERWRAASELAELPDTAAAERELAEALADPTVATRWNAAVALAWLGRDDGLSLIHAGLRSPLRWRRWEAIHALGRVHDGESAAALGSVLVSGDARERGEAALVLGRIGGEMALSALLGAIRDKDPGVRWRVCAALGVAGDRRAVDPLTELRGDERDPRVLQAVEQALARLRES